jgi:hypothetical protein
MEQQHIPDLFSLRKAISHKNQNYWLERLANELPVIIAKAADSANPRKEHFNLDKLTIPVYLRTRSGSEADWEGLCLSRWSIRHGLKTPKPIQNAWHRLVARQVPLEPPIYQRQLLTADLMGISEDGFPVVVELKGHTKQAAILALILQALDYGMRLRESWSYFFEEWREVLSKYHWPTVQSHPHLIHLVCAAPSDVWQREQMPRFAPDLRRYLELEKALASCGCPLSLVSLSRRKVNKLGFRVVAKPVGFAPTSIPTTQNSESTELRHGHEKSTYPRHPDNRNPTQRVQKPIRRKETAGLSHVQLGGRYLHNNRLFIRTIERIEGDDVWWRSDSDSGICKRNTFLKKCCGFALGSQPPQDASPREYISKAVVTEMAGRMATLRQFNRTVENIVNGISQIYSTEALRQLMSAFEARSMLSQQVHELLESYLAQKVRGRDQNRKTLLEMASLMKQMQPFNEIIERCVSPLVNNPEEECRSDLSRALEESSDITAKTMSRLITLLN